MSNILINEASLRNLARDILIAYGAEDSEADMVAGALVWCNRMGRPNYGVWRLRTLTQRVSVNHIKSPCHPRFLKTALAVGILDGDQGFGYFVGHRAMQEALELARQPGRGWSA